MKNKNNGNNKVRKEGKVWISPDIFEIDLRPEGWPDDPALRRAVDWLLSFVNPEEWKDRRFAALQHFIDSATGHRTAPTDKGRFFDDKDRFAWYLFLGQAFLDHPTIYDFMYGSRVVPILTSIGRDLELLRSVGGVETRVRRMIGPEKGQPNACLFELLVAAAYRRAGATVNFLEEHPGVAKTHDMDVLLNGNNWAIECKRMEDGEFAEAERTRARELWLPLAHAFHNKGLSVLASVDFVKEMSAVPDDYLFRKAQKWLDIGALFPHGWSDEYSVGKLQYLDLGPLQRTLAIDDVAINSSRMHELLLGHYKRNAHIISSLHIQLADNPLYANSCDAGCVFDWTSRSDASIDRRARDVLKRVADGCRQLPNGRPSIVHIGFEAVDDMNVEAIRYEKVMRSLANFDPLEKQLEYVFVTWFAPESPPDTAIAFDETCHWQAIRPTHSKPLDDILLVQLPGIESRSGVHWRP